MARTEKPHYTFTYDIVTLESAENGDTAENGYWMPGGWTYPLKGEGLFKHAARNLRDARKGAFDHPLEADSIRHILHTMGALDVVQVCKCTVIAYEAEGNVDFSTGAMTRRAVHIECATEEDAKRIAERLKPKPRATRVGG